MAFLIGQSWYILKSLYTVGGPEQGFGAGSQIDLTRGSILNVLQAVLKLYRKFMAMAE